MVECSDLFSEQIQEQTKLQGIKNDEQNYRDDNNYHWFIWDNLQCN
ncbi:hypothetical protein SDC9_139398 [bioreactor metagenome]|uniref:Uncharacterized protein n=1 Tax=bioreactor metagenome TaxID=1076179 RepID=A0A645DUJ4_9ZZZZ